LTSGGKGVGVGAGDGLSSGKGLGVGDGSSPLGWLEGVKGEVEPLGVGWGEMEVPTWQPQASNPNPIHFHLRCMGFLFVKSGNLAAGGDFADGEVAFVEDVDVPGGVHIQCSDATKLRF
jgi:hypothetical protein